MFPWNLFPLNKDTKNMMQQMKPEEIQKYVQSMVGKMFPPNMEGMHSPPTFKNNFSDASMSHTPTNPAIETMVFETHDYVFVRITMKQEDWINKLKLYHTSNHVIIENIPEASDQHKIVLPAIVKKKGATARLKDSMLEVRIPKNNDLQFSEIDVTENY